MATHSYSNGYHPCGVLTVGAAGEHVTIEIDRDQDHGAHLTADQARALAADLLTHANQLSAPSDEELIRDAMAEAQDHPGRIVTR